jgi:hypothetical protein
MIEYTLVFRRPVAGPSPKGTSGRGWVVARPLLPTAGNTIAGEGRQVDDLSMAQVFVVPICSALSLDGVAYEQFLVESDVLPAAIAMLGTRSLTRPASVVTARKEVQALVMAAEVQHIIDRMSA